jgi:hypothetical protein
VGERRLHAGVEGVGVEPVHEQQARHQLVLGHPGDDLVGRRARVVDDAHDVPEASAVELDDEVHELLDPLPRRRTGGRTELLEQPLDALPSVSKPFTLGHRVSRTSRRQRANTTAAGRLVCARAIARA